MNVYLASEYDYKRGYGAYCAFYEQDNQHVLRGWRTQQKATEDSLALEAACDALEQIVNIIPIVIYTENHTLLKGCVEYIGERRRKMSMGQSVNHARLWQYLDRHIDEWAGYNVALEWRLGSHSYAKKELSRLMVVR